MRRWLQSRQYSHSEHMAPMFEIIYYDDETFDVYECLFKLSAIAVQDINTRGCIGEITIEGVDTFFELSDKGDSSCKLIENKRYSDVDIDSIESSVLKNIEDIKSLGLSFTIYKGHIIHGNYFGYYDIILENIKLYRREKNLNNLGI